MSQPHGTALGKIEINGMRCWGRHGAYEGEQQIERLYLVDVAVTADLAPAAEADSLDAALDIAALSETVRGIVAGEARTLLETLAVGAAQQLLARFPEARDVYVRIAKPDPPGIDAREEAVQVTLTRD